MKTKKIKDGYGDKKFISPQEYEAITFIDNGGEPNSKKTNYANFGLLMKFKGESYEQGQKYFNEIM